MDIREVVQPKLNPNIPAVAPGDTVRVAVRVIEGDKERLQHFQGMVIRTRRGVDGGSFTVRRVVYGVGVERTFPFQSPLVQGVEILRHGKTRRAKLYYMRNLSAKRARLKERRARAPQVKRPEAEKAEPEEAEPEEAEPEEEE